MTIFILQRTSNYSIFEYSFPQEFLDTKYEIALLKLNGNLEININQTNNKFYYLVNGVDKNNNPVNEANVIDIPGGKYDFDELIMKINGLLKRDKNFFKANLEDGKVTIDIKKDIQPISVKKYIG